MGDGVTGSGNAPPANQTTNAGQSGAQSQADAAAQSAFGETLKQESLCPEGFSPPPASKHDFREIDIPPASISPPSAPKHDFREIDIPPASISPPPAPKHDFREIDIPPASIFFRPS